MDDQENEKEEYDWSHYGDHDAKKLPPLEGKDYLAIFIASLQTIFLPLIILIFILLGISLGITFLFPPPVP
jgi:hypothetical protein